MKEVDEHQHDHDEKEAKWDSHIPRIAEIPGVEEIKHQSPNFLPCLRQMNFACFILPNRK